MPAKKKEVVEETKVEEAKEVKKETKTTKVKKEKAEKTSTKKESKKTKKEEVVETGPKATLQDFEVILEPVITEKSMTKSQEENKFTFKVKKGASKTEIRKAIERIYKVHVVGISTVNVHAKASSRGSRYKGHISGYKKAVVTLKLGETINLFAE